MMGVCPPSQNMVRAVLIVLYSILLGDGELVWCRLRVLEVSIYHSQDDYHVGVLCIVPWVCDVLLVCH